APVQGVAKRADFLFHPLQAHLQAPVLDLHGGQQATKLFELGHWFRYASSSTRQERHYQASLRVDSRAAPCIYTQERNRVQSRGGVSTSSLAYSPPGGGSCRRAGGNSTGSTTAKALIKYLDVGAQCMRVGCLASQRERPCFSDPGGAGPFPSG